MGLTLQKAHQAVNNSLWNIRSKDLQLTEQAQERGCSYRSTKSTASHNKQIVTNKLNKITKLKN